jgi:predicted lipoprotein
MIAMRPRKTMAGVLLGLAALCQPLLAQGQEAPPRPFDHGGLARQALEKHIAPGYARLANAARALSQALDRSCARPSSRPPRAVDAAFSELVAAWGRVEHINFGPVTADNRLERILFFPDRRGSGARQIARALEDRDPAVTDASALAGRSVALQGLGALDVVLYGLAPSRTGTPEQRAHRCAYARAIAANVAGLTRVIVEEWSAPDGYRHDWLNAGTGSRAFVKPSETTLVLAKAFNQGLERVRDERLGAALGLNRQRRRMPAVLAKSGLSLVLVKANLDGLIELYEIGGMHRAIAPPGLREDREGIAAKARLVAAELASARDIVAASARVPSPFDDAAVSRRLIAVGFPLKNARELAHEVLALTANLTLGFNSSDGD